MKLLKYFYTFLFIIFSIHFLNAQPNVLWEKTYGNSDEDRANAVAQTSDGGFIITGYTFIPAFGQYLYVLRTDSAGDTLWTRTYGNSGQVTGGEAVHETSDGNFIVAANIIGQFTLLKINPAGDTLWTKSYSSISDAIRCNDMIITNDGGFIIVGYKNFPNMLQNIFLMKVDETGNVLWTKDYGGDFTDIGNAIQQTTDGGYIVCGNLQVSGAGSEIWLLKTNQFGDTLWTKTFGTSLNEFGYDVKQTSDGGYIVSGTTENIYKLWLIKTDSNGDTLWSKKFNYQIAANRYPKQGNSIIQTNDGGYAVAGFSGINNSAGAEDIYIIKMNSIGDTLWTKSFGGLNVPDRANFIMQTDNGGYIAAGYKTDIALSRRDVWIARIEPEVMSFDPLLYEGNWRGTWFNNTFQSTDSAFISVGVNQSASSMEIIFDLDGNVFGGPDPDPATLNGTYDNTGASLTGNSPTYGETFLTMLPSGKIIMRMPNVPNPAIDSTIINGTSNSTSIDLTYIVYFTGGSSTANGVIHLEKDMVTGIENDGNFLSDFNLSQNYPNPFNPSTTIRYSIPRKSNVSLILYDILGNKVSELVNGEKAPGFYEVKFNASRLASGVYLYRIQANNQESGKAFVITKKMILLK